MKNKLFLLLAVLAFSAQAQIYCPTSVKCTGSTIQSCYISFDDHQYWGNLEAGGQIIPTAYAFDHTNWILSSGKQYSSCIYRHNDPRNGDSFVYVHNVVPLQPNTQSASDWFFKTNSYASCLGTLNTNCPYAEINLKK